MLDNVIQTCYGVCEGAAVPLRAMTRWNSLGRGRAARNAGAVICPGQTLKKGGLLPLESSHHVLVLSIDQLEASLMCHMELNAADIAA